jgi:hypothetical protein
MELELKILKEKVVEDEKKSGIGSLFDDEKSSFQHISLLKQKYQKMRRDYDKRIEELNKLKLKIIGEQFVLDSQINIMLSQNQKVEDQQRDYNAVYLKRHTELDRELKEVSKQRVDTENDVRLQEKDEDREGNENYESTMYIIKDNTFDELSKVRHKMEIELYTKLITDKELEIQNFQAARGDVKTKISGLVEY